MSYYTHYSECDGVNEMCRRLSNVIDMREKQKH